MSVATGIPLRWLMPHIVTFPCDGRANPRLRLGYERQQILNLARGVRLRGGALLCVADALGPERTGKAASKQADITSLPFPLAGAGVAALPRPRRLRSFLPPKA